MGMLERMGREAFLAFALAEDGEDGEEAGHEEDEGAAAAAANGNGNGGRKRKRPSSSSLVSPLAGPPPVVDVSLAPDAARVFEQVKMRYEQLRNMLMEEHATARRLGEYT